MGLQRRMVAAVGGLVFGLVLAALGLGLVLGRLGVYLLAPPIVFAGWAIAGGVVAWGAVLLRRRMGRTEPSALARIVEMECGLRHGSIVGIAERARVPVSRGADSSVRVT